MIRFTQDSETDQLTSRDDADNSSNGGRPVLPGSTIGVIGGGQLGRMFALEAVKMGYRVRVLSPSADDPAAQVATEHVAALYEDLEAAERFAHGLAVVTYEFEHLSVDAVLRVAEVVPVKPSPWVLGISQDRIREKQFFKRCGFGLPGFAEVGSPEQLRHAFEQLGSPCVLKSARGGYDGKGQAIVHAADQLDEAWVKVGGGPAVLEQFVEFVGELGMLVARNAAGEVRTIGPIANIHRRHILDTSVWPAPVTPGVAQRADIIARAAAEALDLEGVMCVELFLGEAGELWVNEFAPRPHNCGHLTLEAFSVNQFQLQLRAVCGLPLPEAEPRAQGAAMANLLGDLWGDAGSEAPNWSAGLREPNVQLHLYGKANARVGRKMGHITATCEDGESALAEVLGARRALADSVSTSGQSSVHSSPLEAKPAAAEMNTTASRTP